MARLNLPTTNAYPFWLKHDQDSEPWIQFDFIARVFVEKIQTQGSTTQSIWVKTFKLLYSDDGYIFMEYHEDNVTKVCKITFFLSRVRYLHIAVANRPNILVI